MKPADPNSEAAIQHQIILAYGAKPGLRIWRQNTGAMKNATGRLVRFGVPGQADISGVLAPTGRAVFIEVKSPTGRQSADQKDFQRIVTSVGGLYILARSVADVAAVLDPILPRGLHDVR